MKRFGGPGELPVSMIDAWRRAVMIGGPYRDRLPPVRDPQHDLFDEMEARHVGVDRRAQPVSGRVGDQHSGGCSTVSGSRRGV